MNKFMLFLLLAFFYTRIAAQNPVNLSATWELRSVNEPTLETIIPIYIKDQNGTLSVSGNGFNGVGKFSGTTGYYTWTFSDGRTGKTTFTYQPEYDILRGKVGGSGIYWDFTASRQSTGINNFSGTWYSPTFDQFFILTQQFDNIGGYYGPDNAQITGNASGNHIYLHFGGPSKSGLIDGYLSLDGQKLFINRWHTVPGKTFGTLVFERTRGQLTASSPPGWMNSNHTQNCIQGGMGSTVSCVSPYGTVSKNLGLDPRTEEIIDSWLAQTLPFPNWTKARYDCWGRWVGASPGGGVTTHSCLPPETDGRTRSEYLLYFFGNTYSQTLKSTLLQYVKNHLKN